MNTGDCFIRPSAPVTFRFKSELSDGRKVTVEATVQPSDEGNLHRLPFGPDVEIDAIYDADQEEITEELDEDEIDALYAEAVEVHCFNEEVA